MNEDKQGRIAPMRFPRHEGAIQWVNDLVIDLKKQILGYPAERPITMERLDEWTKTHIHDLNRCTDPGIRY